MALLGALLILFVIIMIYCSVADFTERLIAPTVFVVIQDEDCCDSDSE